jgi:SAM-dependent methyltransferase
MTDAGEPPRDRWADWLVSGRQRGLDERRQRRLQRHLERLRDRVLRGARLRPGEHVLDVGAGTGLIALAARRRVGPSGLVVALDISHDALQESERAAAAEPDAAPLRTIRADATRLPLADASFDAVFTRSVLMYLPDHAAGVREIHRVLRPGGRAAVFEPINRVNRDDAWNGGRDLSDVQPEHGRIVAFLQQGQEERNPMLDFDERDLVRWFVDAGFTSVGLIYEVSYSHGAPRASAAQVLAALRQRPNPLQLSYEESAGAVLGDRAAAYLKRYVELIRSRPGRRVSAAAYLTAVK